LERIQKMVVVETRRLTANKGTKKKKKKKKLSAE
jgi:hypothetical protein